MVRTIHPRASKKLSASPAKPSRSGERTLALAERDPSAAVTQPTAPPTRRRLKGLSVLVVEDDADARDIFRKMLRLEGAAVLGAPNGIAALELCASNARVDVILCDLLMPWLDGHGFLRRLRAEPKRANVPVIAVTALAHDRDYLRTFESGFVRHLTKPVEFETLIETVLRVTREGRT
jgi:CheY-like chemotaxis protein